jgi:hypothetical protein
MPITKSRNDNLPYVGYCGRFLKEAGLLPLVESAENNVSSKVEIEEKSAHPYVNLR